MRTRSLRTPAARSAPIDTRRPACRIAGAVAGRVADPEGGAEPAFVKTSLAARFLNSGILSLVLVHVVSISPRLLGSRSRYAALRSCPSSPSALTVISVVSALAWRPVTG
jgi:hypothetical protein